MSASLSLPLILTELTLTLVQDLIRTAQLLVNAKADVREKDEVTGKG